MSLHNRSIASRPCPALAFCALFCLSWLADPVAAQESLKPTATKKVRNPAKLSVAQRNVHLSAQRAMEWLHKANKPDGRFVYGFLPALRLPVEGDDYVHQAAAAFALGHAARVLEDERAAAIARQAVLTLLLETTLDPKEKHLRYTAAPPHLVNRAAATSFLSLAIYDLPSPGADLLEQAEQMTNFLRSLIAADGSLRLAEKAEGSRGEETDLATLHFSGPALYAIIRSHAHKPAAWKLEALRRACPLYHAYWTRNKNMPMVAYHAAAYAEAFTLTKERAFSDCVFAMADWLCEQQITRPDPRHNHWQGGFLPCRDGKVASGMPDAGSGACAFALAQACRTARMAGDAARLERYQKSLESCLAFLTTLQYTDARVQHFAEWFRPAILGGFHASPQDGNLRIDYTQQCLLAQVDYLCLVLEW